MNKGKRMYWQRMNLILVSSVIMMGFILFVWWSFANARAIAGGAGNCGEFIDAIYLAEDGDTIMQMASPKDSEGAVITKNLRISGGWLPTVNCEENNQVFTTTTDFLGYGFIYTPATLSELNYFGSVLTLEDINAPGFPNLDSLVLENLVLHSDGTPQDGGGVQGVISDSAEVLIDNVSFPQNSVSGNGGGLSLEVRGGSHLIIEDSWFQNNTADNYGGGLYVTLRENSQLTIDRSRITNNHALFGGGLEIQVYDTSRVIIRDTEFSQNSTTSLNGYGGAIEIIMHGGQVEILNSTFTGNWAGNDQGRGGGLFIQMDGGTVTIQNSTFSNNSAGGGGGGLYVDSVGNEPATVKVINSWFTNNTPNAYAYTQTGSGALNFLVLDQNTYLPTLLNNFSPDLQSARINNITLDENFNYIVDFDTFNFVPALPGVHVHFFFDTVTPENAGMPGTGPWFVYGGYSPFTGYNFADRPYEAGGAEKMCILVANPDHTVRLNTGNCVELP